MLGTMEATNILPITTRAQFRGWLERHHASASECWVPIKRGKTPIPGRLWYLDAVEEALCFGWIDAVHKTIDGVDTQRFTPRTARSPWSELNKERCRRLEKLGLMTDAGRAALPDMGESGFRIDEDIRRAFADNPVAWENFSRFPALYQRVRIDSIQRDKRRDRKVFDQRVRRLVEKSAENVMFGDWNDDGRLLDY
jgi:uncharacterized protein YdeI (YjbR/CyaY-like superfamily)